MQPMSPMHRRVAHTLITTDLPECQVECVILYDASLPDPAHMPEHQRMVRWNSGLTRDFDARQETLAFRELFKLER